MIYLLRFWTAYEGFQLLYITDSLELANKEYQAEIVKRKGGLIGEWIDLAEIPLNQRVEAKIIHEYKEASSND